MWQSGPVKRRSADRRERWLLTVAGVGGLATVGGLTVLFVWLGLDVASKAAGIVSVYLALIALYAPVLTELVRRWVRSPRNTSSEPTADHADAATAISHETESRRTPPPVDPERRLAPVTPNQPAASPAPKPHPPSAAPVPPLQPPAGCPAPAQAQLRVGGDEMMERIMPILADFDHALHAIIAGWNSVFFGLFDLGENDLHRREKTLRRIGRMAGTALGIGLPFAVIIAGGVMRLPVLLGLGVVAMCSGLLLARSGADLTLAGTALSLAALTGICASIFIAHWWSASLAEALVGVGIGLLTGGPVLTVATAVRVRSWPRAK